MTNGLWLLALIAQLAWLGGFAVSSLSAGETKKGERPVIVMKTSLGEIAIELDAAKAPKTTENFVKYVEDGHYNGTIFHRVIDGFMIQGGGFAPGLKEKKNGSPIVNEADNGLRNTRGTIAMARTSDPHSATAQFFINVADNAFLDFKSKTPQGWGYAVFGKVTRGMEVIDQIRKVSTATKGPHQNVPREDVVIESVKIELR